MFSILEDNMEVGVNLENPFTTLPHMAGLLFKLTTHLPCRASLLQICSMFKTELKLCRVKQFHIFVFSFIFKV